MNLFAYLDNLLFGPTLQFEATTKYSLEDAVQRLRAAVIPRFSLAGIFRTGLKGTVRADHVCVRWKDSWSRNTLRPSFLGEFVLESGGVRLLGQIGIRIWQKAPLLAFIPVEICVWIVMTHISQEAFMPQFVRPFFFAAIAFFFIAQFLILRAFRRDYQLIADALDNALS